MSHLLNTLRQTAARDTKLRVRKLVWTIAMGVMSCLIALGGIGFLTTWLFMTLSLEMGSRWAALLIGLILIFLAAIMLAVAAKVSFKPTVKVAPKNQHETSDTSASDGTAMIAFTAAYVLSRYLTGGKRN